MSIDLANSALIAFGIVAIGMIVQGIRGMLRLRRRGVMLKIGGGDYILTKLDDDTYILRRRPKS
jgi:hypothetical protein